MPDSSRTFVIGDIHGDTPALDRLMGKLLPNLSTRDTLIFIGDYVDRGPDSKGVVQRVRSLQKAGRWNIITLRGNHEDKWISCFKQAEPTFMLPAGNGCANTFRSFSGGPPLGEDESLSTSEFQRFFEVKSWMPADVHEWMAGLPFWYEDEHALYVHAGLDGEGDAWKHPRDAREKVLLWMREPDFFANYRGKRVVFGHTLVSELPIDHITGIKKWIDDPGDVWVRGDLVGIDTGAGKGGFLSAVELPRGKVYESR